MTAFTSDTWQPDWTCHPGETLREALADRRMSQVRLSALIRVSNNVISDIICGQMGISPRMAILLEQALEIPAKFWVRLQADHSLYLAYQKMKPSIPANGTMRDDE